jgi:hypothetical protein
MLGCEKEAEFSIYDQQEHRPGVGVTFACVEHVGALLGSVPQSEPMSNCVTLRKDMGHGPWTVYCLTRVGTAMTEDEHFGSTHAGLAEAFAIFAKYEEGRPSLCRKHNEIWTGPSRDDGDAPVSRTDATRLASLGWDFDGDIGRWHKFT